MNLVYPFIKATSYRAFTVFFRKIFITGRELIPKDKKIIIALNHPTACMEPILFGDSLDFHVHVLLRGDAFLSKPVEWFLRRIKTIPIFRSRDGIAALRKMEMVMDEIKQTLHEGKDGILVLAEGTSAHEKRLRPLQKGLARMAFDTYEKYGDRDIVIVPTAVNYTDVHRFRSIVSFEVCEPILLEDYLELYEENKARAIKKLTKDVQTAMRSKVIHIADPADDDTVNLLSELLRNEIDFSEFPYTEDDPTLARKEYRLTENFNKKSKEERLALAAQTDAYRRRLVEYRAEDQGAAQPEKSNFWNWMILIVLFPFHLAGLIWNFPPLRFARHFADKKSPEIKFHASIRYGVGYIGWMIWYLLWIIGVWIFSNWVGALATAILMPVLGRMSLIYMDFRSDVSAAYNYNSLSKEKQEAIQMMRRKLLAQVGF